MILLTKDYGLRTTDCHPDVFLTFRCFFCEAFFSFFVFHRYDCQFYLEVTKDLQGKLRSISVGIDIVKTSEGRQRKLFYPSQSILLFCKYTNNFPNFQYFTSYYFLLSPINFHYLPKRLHQCRNFASSIDSHPSTPNL